MRFGVLFFFGGGVGGGLEGEFGVGGDNVGLVGGVRWDVWFPRWVSSVGSVSWGWGWLGFWVFSSVVGVGLVGGYCVSCWIVGVGSSWSVCRLWLVGWLVLCGWIGSGSAVGSCSVLGNGIMKILARFFKFVNILGWYCGVLCVCLL